MSNAGRAAASEGLESPRMCILAILALSGTPAEYQASEAWQLKGAFKTQATRPSVIFTSPSALDDRVYG